MNCPNCKKDLVFGTECDTPACVALRPVQEVVTEVGDEVSVITAADVDALIDATIAGVVVEEKPKKKTGVRAAVKKLLTKKRK